MLADLGLPMAPQEVVTNEKEAVEAATRLGYPVVMKILAEGVSHKSDVGGVVLGLASAKAVREAAHKLLRVGREAGDESPRLLIQPMLSGVAEVIVGFQRDPVFGPVILVGFGGIFTEIFRDVSLRLAPINKRDAEEMLSDLKTANLLKGFRGRPMADVDSLVELICKVSEFGKRRDIYEMDLNPVLVMPKGEGCVVLDNRIVRYD